MSDNVRVSRSVVDERFDISPDVIAQFCKKHHIREMSLFGSVVRDDFGPESDIDVLVEFEAGHVPGLITLAGFEHELSELLGGRKVDINTSLTLSPYFRDEVLQEAEVLYVQACVAVIEGACPYTKDSTWRDWLRETWGFLTGTFNPAKW